MRQLFLALRGNQEAINQFHSAISYASVALHLGAAVTRLRAVTKLAEQRVTAAPADQDTPLEFPLRPRYADTLHQDRR